MNSLRVGLTDMSYPRAMLFMGAFLCLFPGTGMAYALWPTGLVIPAAGLAFLYLAVCYPHFQTWVEFGEQVKVRSGNWSPEIKTYDWRDVVRFVYTFDIDADDCAHHVGLIIQGHKEDTVTFFPSDLENVAKTLSTGLHSQESEIRESVVHGLSRLGCTKYFVTDPPKSYVRSYDESVAKMRKGVVSHLEEVLDDPDERVRAAAADALSSIRLCISEEQS